MCTSLFKVIKKQGTLILHIYKYLLHADIKKDGSSHPVKTARIKSISFTRENELSFFSRSDCFVDPPGITQTIRLLSPYSKSYNKLFT